MLIYVNTKYIMLVATVVLLIKDGLRKLENANPVLIWNCLNYFHCIITK